MAAATAIIGTALSVGGAGMNFAQAAKQDKLKQQAERDAEKAMKAARARLEANFYEGLEINLKSFDQELDALAGSSRQVVQAGQESDRGAAAVAGNVLLASQKAEQSITDRQIDAVENLEMKVAAEESRLRNAKVNLDLGEVEGAQAAAAEADINKAANISAGLQGLGSAATGLFEGSELYGKSEDVRNLNKIRRKAGRAERRADIASGVQEGTDVGNFFRGVTGLFGGGN